MKTVTIQTGNSDDKLTQKQWATFVMEAENIIYLWSEQFHFSAPSIGSMSWQNFCWVVEIEADRARNLKERLSTLKKQYGQDSIAWTEGETEMI